MGHFGTVEQKNGVMGENEIAVVMEGERACVRVWESERW